MNKLLVLFCTVAFLSSCKEEHPIQTPDEAAFDNYAKVMRIVSVSRDEVVLKNNTGTVDTISVFYFFRSSDSSDVTLVHDASAPEDYIMLAHQQYYTFSTPYPIDFLTDTVFLYKREEHRTDTILVDTYYPPGQQIGF